MKTQYIAAAVLSAMLLNPLPAGAEGKNGVAAVVNGEKVTVAELKDSYNALPQLKSQISFDQFYPRMVEAKATETAILQAAKKANIESTPEYKKQLDAVKKQVMSNVYIQQQVEGKITDNDVKNLYNQYKKEFKPQKEMSARHILVGDEATANDIIAKIKKGENFDQLAKTYSEEKNPNLGYFTKQMMVPEFADAAFRMKKGQYSQKPIKTNFGYHVIIVDDVRDSKPISYQEAEPQLRQALAQKTAQSVLKNILDNAKIEQYQLDGKPMPKTPAAQ